MRRGIEGEGKGGGGWESEEGRGVGRAREQTEGWGDSELEEAIFTKAVSDMS